ncbi:MAG: hypothetical protein JWP56_1116 [Aeromicrobium sp.]|nr:hypothetical protein [Aeromicrobium sp.]
MPEMVSTRAGSSDAELILAVRSGDTEAYGDLFDRHRDAALRMARQLVRGPDADDLVAESFYRVLTTLQAGKGPDESFRAYLLTSIRRLHIDRIRAGSRITTTDDESALDRAVEFVDPAEMRFEQGAAAAAFASLPERWQLVLWHLDVEGQKPAQIAPLLGMSANSVSALAYRAREGLRQAYLQGHLAPSLHASCRTTTGLLGAYVRKGLSARDRGRVDAHLDGCSRCTGLLLELTEVNSDLSGVLGPALLGPAFGGYVAAMATAGVVSAGAATGAALGVKLVAGQAAKLVLEPVKILGSAVAGAGTQGVVAAAVVTGVATAGTVAVTTDFGTTARDEPSVSAPRVPMATPTPGPATSAEPSISTPTPDTTQPTPTVEPEAVPTVAPEPTQPTEPSAPVEADPEPSPTPEPEPEPIVPTDYGVGAVTITNDDTLLQRRFSIPVTATNPGRAADQVVTVTMAFSRTVTFRGVVSPGWDCGSAVRNQRLTTLTCSTTLAAGQGTTFVTKARALLPPAGSIRVTAADDPAPGNNTASFRARPYLLVL